MKASRNDEISTDLDFKDLLSSNADNKQEFEEHSLQETVKQFKLKQNDYNSSKGGSSLEDLFKENDNITTKDCGNEFGTLENSNEEMHEFTEIKKSSKKQTGRKQRRSVTFKGRSDESDDSSVSTNSSQSSTVIRKNVKSESTKEERNKKPRPKTKLEAISSESEVSDDSDDDSDDVKMKNVKKKATTKKPAKPQKKIKNEKKSSGDKGKANKKSDDSKSFTSTVAFPQTDIDALKSKLSADEIAVFDFFYNVNRPVANSELALSFKKKITPANLNKITEKLENLGLLISKMYSKSKICMISPKAFDTSKVEEYETLIDKLSADNQELESHLAQLVSDLRQITDQLTDDDLIAKIESLEDLIEANKIKVENMENGNYVDVSEYDSVCGKIKELEKCLKTRKSMFNNIVETISDAMGIKKKDLFNEMGLEF